MLKLFLLRPCENERTARITLKDMMAMMIQNIFKNPIQEKEEKFHFWPRSSSLIFYFFFISCFYLFLLLEEEK